MKKTVETVIDVFLVQVTHDLSRGLTITYKTNNHFNGFSNKIEKWA